MPYRIECVLECGNHLGEGPIWDVEEGRLYWVDGTGRRVGNPSIWRLDPRTGRTDTWSLAQDIGALALRRNGGAVLARSDRHHTCGTSFEGVCPKFCIGFSFGRTAPRLCKMEVSTGHLV